MSIVELIEHQGNILAVNDAGSLILWDLKQIKKIQGTYVFKDNLSLVPSKGSLKIDANQLQGIKAYQDTIVMYSKQTIYVTNQHHILQGIRDERIKNNDAINCIDFLEKKEIINCLVVVHQQSIIFGTNKGNIYKYNCASESQPVSRIEFANQSKNQQNQIPIFATIQKQVVQVNSIQLYSEFALVGLSNGKIYSIRTENLQIVFELTANFKAKLEPVQKIVISKDQKKIYVLHQNYITQWSLKLCSCLSYIDYPHPKDLLVQHDRIMIIGNHSKLIWYDTVQKEYNLSMRSAQTIKQISDGLVAVGGSDQLVDILMGGMRLMTLFYHK